MKHIVNYTFCGCCRYHFYLTLWPQKTHRALYHVRKHHKKTSWWFLPIWKVSVKLDHFPGRGENKTSLKLPRKGSLPSSIKLLRMFQKKLMENKHRKKNRWALETQCLMITSTLPFFLKATGWLVLGVSSWWSKLTATCFQVTKNLFFMLFCSYTPEDEHRTWKRWFGRSISFPGVYSQVPC